MADIILSLHSSLPDTVKFKYKDMGDGTYALVNAIDGSSVSNAILVEFTRKAETETLTHTDSADSDVFIDIKPYASVEFVIPEAFNGLSMDILFADDTAGTNKAIPKYLTSDSYTGFVQVASVSTGERYVIQAEAFAGHYFGLRFGDDVTGTITLHLKS